MSELVDLFNAVKQNFADNGETANFVFGRRERSKQDNQGPGGANRVVFQYGDPNGALGDDLPPRFPGALPARPLADLNELFTVYVWAYDVSAPDDETVQYEAAKALYNAWRRAMYLVAEKRFTMGKPRVLTKDTERTNGIEIEIVCSLRSVTRDTPYTLAVPPLHSTTTVTMLDQEQTVTT